MRGIAAQLINCNMIHSLVTPYNHDPHLRRSTCETGAAVQYFPSNATVEQSHPPETNRQISPELPAPVAFLVAAALAIAKQCPKTCTAWLERCSPVWRKILPLVHQLVHQMRVK